MLEKGFAVPDLLQPALPAPASWFPLPFGWLILGILTCASLALYLLFYLASWRRNRWRREAFSAMQRAQNVDSWLCLIKRVLLIHQPRAAISRDNAPESILRYVPVDEDLRHLLCSKYCQVENQLDDNQTVRLRTQLTHWLEGLPNV